MQLYVPDPSICVVSMSLQLRKKRNGSCQYYVRITLVSYTDLRHHCKRFRSPSEKQTQLKPLSPI